MVSVNIAAETKKKGIVLVVAEKRNLIDHYTNFILAIISEALVLTDTSYCLKTIKPYSSG